MKLLPLFVTLVLSSSAFAVTFNNDGFGGQLNGWHKNRTATYSFTDARYRTHMPTITATPSGGMFLTTQVDLLGGGKKGAVTYLSLTFSRSGVLESAQIRGTRGGKEIDTGMIRRPEAPAAPMAAEGEAAAPAKPFHATDELINELFNRLDAELNKKDAKEGERRDLFSRLSGGSRQADLAAGLRHNINLILQNVVR